MSKKISFKTFMLRSNLGNYPDAYIAVKGNITVAGPNDNVYDKKLALKNNASFIICMPKINNTLADKTEGLHAVMPRYILIEYNKTYWKTSGSLWNYYREEINDDRNDNNKNIIKSKSFKYKASINENIYNVNEDDGDYDPNEFGTKEAETETIEQFLERAKHIFS